MLYPNSFLPFLWILNGLMVAWVIRDIVLTVRKNKKRLRELNEVRTTVRAQLDAEVLAVSKLVTDRCPNSLEAHRLVIEAAQCLVLPYSARRIITADDYRNRYQNGFDLLKQARAVADA